MKRVDSFAAKAEMLIRKPVTDVFEAFVDPAITSKFWSSQGNARLEPGKTVRWDWQMYGFSQQVDVLAVEANKRILVQWRAYGDPTPIEWLFAPRPDDTTFVSITNSGFSDAQQALDSTEGFAFVLAGAKALLEHDIMLNLVPDRFPDGLPSQ
jgi:uncharacterized protein YndB with AHSA1/START domain